MLYVILKTGYSKGYAWSNQRGPGLAVIASGDGKHDIPPLHASSPVSAAASIIRHASTSDAWHAVISDCRVASWAMLGRRTSGTQIWTGRGPAARSRARIACIRCLGPVGCSLVCMRSTIFYILNMLRCFGWIVKRVLPLPCLLRLGFLAVHLGQCLFVVVRGPLARGQAIWPALLLYGLVDIGGQGTAMEVVPSSP